MKRLLILFVSLALLLACSSSDDDAVWTYQSVIDFDNGLFPQTINDTIIFNGVVTMSPNSTSVNSPNYDASFKADAVLKISREYYDNRLRYRIHVLFEDEFHDGASYSIKKGNWVIDNVDTETIQCLNYIGTVVNLISEYEFFFIRSQSPLVIDDYIFKENKVYP